MANLAALLEGLDLWRARERHVMVAVLRNGNQPRRAIRGHQQRLGACPENTVTALELGAVDSEVSLMDELVRVGAVFREAGDSYRDGRTDWVARGLDVERALGDRAADPLGDLHGLILRRLGQEDRELLPTEPGRYVVVTELGSEDFCDYLQHGVAGEVTVGVVDVAQEIEVGHDQRHRAFEAAGASNLLRERSCEVAGVEQPRLRVHARLRLQCRNAQRTVDQEQWSEREGNEPGVRLPELVDGDAQRREHEIRGDVLSVEETCLT